MKRPCRISLPPELAHLGKQQIQEIIDRYESNPEHGLSIEAWAGFLAALSDDYKSRGLPAPTAFRSHQHRIKVYAQRAAAGKELFHPDEAPHHHRVPKEKSEEPVAAELHPEQMTPIKNQHLPA